jgi:hypothetical protein
MRAATIPQPMSTPTAAGMTAWWVAITEPMVAPMPRCTSILTGTALPSRTVFTGMGSFLAIPFRRVTPAMG